MGVSRQLTVRHGRFADLTHGHALGLSQRGYPARGPIIESSSCLLASLATCTPPFPAGVSISVLPYLKLLADGMAATASGVPESKQTAAMKESGGPGSSAPGSRRISVAVFGINSRSSRCL